MLIREDYSTYHTYYFDRETGKPAYGATKQGYSDESAWSRGQAWGVYGIALNYPHEKTEKLAAAWKGVTDYFLAKIIGMISGIVPVSYTHLDVYKRQLLQPMAS